MSEPVDAAVTIPFCSDHRYRERCDQFADGRDPGLRSEAMDFIEQKAAEGNRRCQDIPLTSRFGQVIITLPGTFLVYSHENYVAALLFADRLPDTLEVLCHRSYEGKTAQQIEKIVRRALQGALQDAQAAAPSFLRDIVLGRGI